MGLGLPVERSPLGTLTLWGGPTRRRLRSWFAVPPRTPAHVLADSFLRVPPTCLTYPEPERMEERGTRWFLRGHPDLSLWAAGRGWITLHSHLTHSAW